MKSEKYICDCANEVSKLIKLTMLLQKKIASSSSVSVSQATTIINIYDNKEISMSDLCKLDGIECSTLTRNIQQLQKQGWVNKRPDVNDKRINMVSLTESGKEKALLIKDAFLNKIQNALCTIPEDSCKQVSDSVSILIQVLQTIEDGGCENECKC